MEDLKQLIQGIYRERISPRQNASKYILDELSGERFENYLREAMREEEDEYSRLLKEINP